MQPNQNRNILVLSNKNEFLRLLETFLSFFARKWLYKYT